MFSTTVSRRAFLGSTAACAISAGDAKASPQPAALQRLSIREFSTDLARVESLRKAVARMRELPPRHPFSWSFQANIHWRPFFPDYVYQQADESEDPGMKVFADITAFSPEVPVFNTCPHGNWWFLPWHRAYLYFFERILRWASEDQNLTLPYWNYSDPTQRRIPSIFTQRTIPGSDDPNSLYLPATVLFRDRNGNPQIFPVRDQSLNLGFAQLTDPVTNSNALSTIPFSNSAPSPPREAFGSPQACDASCTCGSGALERVPHNLVHVAIGGAAIVAGETIRVGFMGDVSTAARDPIFWLHHCQIDRLWQSWLELGDGRANPSDPAWLDYPFSFYDVGDDGRPQAVSITPAEVLELESLGYTYDSLETLPTPVPTLPQPLSAPTQFALMGRSNQSQSVSRPSRALSAPSRARSGFPLSADSSVKLMISTSENQLPERAGVLMAQPPEQAGELFVSIEGVQLEHQPGVYFDAYLALPEDEDPVPNSQHFLGTISFFGLAHDGSSFAHEHGHGQRPLQPMTFRVPNALRASLVDGTNNLPVLFVPQTGTEPTDAAQELAQRGSHANSVTVREVKLFLMK